MGYVRFPCTPLLVCFHLPAISSPWRLVSGHFAAESPRWLRSPQEATAISPHFSIAGRTGPNLFRVGSSSLCPGCVWGPIDSTLCGSCTTEWGTCSSCRWHRLLPTRSPWIWHKSQACVPGSPKGTLTTPCLQLARSSRSAVSIREGSGAPASCCTALGLRSVLGGGAGDGEAPTHQRPIYPQSLLSATHLSYTNREGQEQRGPGLVPGSSANSAPREGVWPQPFGIS